MSSCASWFPVRGADGEIFGVGLTLLNVTGASAAADAAAKAAEVVAAQIKRSEERYRSLVQGGAQVVWVAAPDGAMNEDSPEWRWITGQSIEQYLGYGWLASIHPEDRERVERDWRECVRTGKVFDDRYRIRTKAGSYRHYDVRAVPIERGGKIAEWVGASTDVTSQREAEEMRGRLTEQLSAAALRAAAAGHLHAGRGAHRRAGRRGDHRGGPDGDRGAPLGGRPARLRQRPAAGRQRRPAQRARLRGR
jgi:PAS domain S-box-containing protein